MKDHKTRAEHGWDHKTRGWDHKKGGITKPWVGSQNPWVGSQNPWVGSQNPWVGSQNPVTVSNNDASLKIVCSYTGLVHRDNENENDAGRIPDPSNFFPKSVVGGYVCPTHWVSKFIDGRLAEHWSMLGSCPIQWKHAWSHDNNYTSCCHGDSQLLTV